MGLNIFCRFEIEVDNELKNGLFLVQVRFVCWVIFLKLFDKIVRNIRKNLVLIMLIIMLFQMFVLIDILDERVIVDVCVLLNEL